MEASHVNEMFRAARAAEIQIKVLTRMHGLAPGLIRRIHLALYGVELWWKIKKIMSKLSKNWSIGKLNYRNVFHSTPIHPLLGEAGLIPAKILLFSCQKSTNIGYSPCPITTPLRTPDPLA